MKKDTRLRMLLHILSAMKKMIDNYRVYLCIAYKTQIIILTLCEPLVTDREIYLKN